MARAFLSHSSKQKKFVERIAKDLGNLAIIDSMTFEEGMGNLEEIFDKLDRTDLFVLFISEDSLKSEYVQKEIAYAKVKLDNEQIQRIYPLIIDKDISYSHPLIPEWLRKLTNLKHVLREGKAYLLIKRRLREITWENHRILKERSLQFVGRFDLLKKIQERLDNIDLESPIALIASGLSKVGRRSLLRTALIDSRVIMRDSYEFPTIAINDRESIEDFILKIYDLGLSEERSFDNLIDLTLDEKIEIVVDLLLDINEASEVVLIEDSGGIVLANASIARWFYYSIERLQKEQDQPSTLICVVSKYRVSPSVARNSSAIFQVSVPELNKQEREQLFKRSAKISGLDLKREDFTYFLDFIHGFPEQIHYCVDLIAIEGLPQARKKVSELTNYRKEVFAAIIQEIEGEKIVKDVLTILTEFDFISYELLYSILFSNTQDEVDSVLDNFISRAIIEPLGANKEYVRLNDGIRDFLQRADYQIHSKYRAYLKSHIENYIKEDSILTADLSDFFYSLRGALMSDYSFQSKLLLPSHYLKAIINLYERNRNYDDVIILANRALEKARKIDFSIRREIHYWLCMALARKGDDRFKEEVQIFKEDLPNYHFLFGFYYRLVGKPEYALENLEIALRHNPRFPKASRELVQVLRSLDLYPEALSHAQYNYEHDKSNAFHIQAYFDCLVKSKEAKSRQFELSGLISELRAINTSKATEMALLAESDYALLVDNDPGEALKKIDYAIDSFGESPYSLMRKFSIFERARDIENMDVTLRAFANRYNSSGIGDRHAYVIMQAKLEAYRGHKNRSRAIVDNLRFYPAKTKAKLLDEIEGI